MEAFLGLPSPARPACLVLDMRMPGMNGLELYRRIAGTTRCMPVIFITGHGDDALRRQALEAGAVDVLQPDVNRLGGITEARRVWALGETFGLDVIPHLGFAHNAQLAITSLATPLLEYLPPAADPDKADEDQIFWVAFPDEPRAIGGRVTLPDRPGLGVSLDRSVLEPTG